MEVYPHVLSYKEEPFILTNTGNFAEPLTEYLTLHNTSSEALAFKVKTTAPKLYCVRPNASIVAPGESVEVSIILQGFTSPLSPDYKCKDKFLIVSCPCPTLNDPSKVAENWATLYQQYGQNGEQKKLRVNYVFDDEDAKDDTHINETSFANATQNTMIRDTSVIKNDEDVTVSHDRSIDPSIASGSIRNQASQSDTTFTKEEEPKIKESQEELDDSATKINNLSEKLDSTEKSSEETIVRPQETVSGVSLPFAAILVLIALLLGWYIF
ncbi:hypothetical protein JCM33374_g5163 [Metschnikowia sp. JCM 33374]|nr:hypothetical protein JCM33374_g5163 [Metschnikowia sp. JCM 33374]